MDKALEGSSSNDEFKIIDVLCSCDVNQRSGLKKTFKLQTKEDLMLVMREELSGNFLELVLVLLREPLAFDIDFFNEYLKVRDV